LKKLQATAGSKVIHIYMLFPSSFGVTDEYNIEMCFIYELPEHKNREQKMAAS
jgi:hypothetical protein